MGGSGLEANQNKVKVFGPDLVAHEAGRPIATRRPWPILLSRFPPAGRPGASCCWRLRAQVTLIVQDGVARVLDTRCGNFYALDLVGTRMLLTSLETSPEAMIRALSRVFQVPEKQVREDWTALVDGLHQAGLTEVHRLQTELGLGPGGFKIWVSLTLARLSFLLFGWERTVRLWRWRSPARLSLAAANVQAVVAAVDVGVRRMASRHLLNPQCKERALVCWSVLRRMGLPMRLVMGIMLYPFAAHAWAECQGQIVGDERARCEQFVPVATYE
jgi:Transglutaminase-like superfamily